jgi:hypothetical protein
VSAYEDDPTLYPPQPDPPDDPRFEWIDVQGFGDEGPNWIRGACRHLLFSAEFSADGRGLAGFPCPDCGRRLPPEGSP